MKGPGALGPPAFGAYDHSLYFAYLNTGVHTQP